VKKFLLLSLVLALTLRACDLSFLNGAKSAAPAATAAPSPLADLAGTAEALAATQASETPVSLSTPTMLPPTETPTPTLEPTEAIPTATATFTATPTMTLTPFLVTETATPLSVTETSTPTPVPTTGATATATQPFPTAPIIINTVPPGYPKGSVDLVNKTNGVIYVSLQGNVENLYHPIQEYEVPRHRTVKTKAPQGDYTVVVYVGKEPMVGYFGLHNRSGVTITIYDDKIEIQH